MAGDSPTPRQEDIEELLRQAVRLPTADSRVRQNLALVVGLQGRFEEAEQIARQELSPAQAEANIEFLRSMLATPDAWTQLAQDPGQRPRLVADAAVAGIQHQLHRLSLIGRVGADNVAGLAEHRNLIEADGLQRAARFL